MARSTRNLEAQGLSTQRISRLLRPLRTKCVALATIHPHVCYKHPARYGSQARSVEFNPLDNLPPPDSGRSYHVEHRSVASLRATIYAIRDCFREVVLKTKTTEAVGSTHRVPRLADLCSTIVGEHMQADEDIGAEQGEDLEQLGEMEYLYDIIPVQYRRSALLAHALDIILRCPHHCTLLSILLDVALQHDLYHESCVLLRSLLYASVAPTSGSGSILRLCHSAHSNYLVDLAQKWKGASQPTGAFVRILTETLSTTARPELWRCKALGKLTRELYSHDFYSFLDMGGGLVSFVGFVQSDEACGNESKIQGSRSIRTKETTLADQLNIWLNYSTPFCSSHPEDLTPIVGFLERCRQSRVHQNTDPLAATIVCWATHYLSLDTLSADAHTTISKLLKDVSPTVTMYNLLVEKSFEVNETSMGGLQHGRAILKAHASCLRAEKHLLLEASLWACILRFVETSVNFLGRCGTEREVSLYREELIELVEDAEQRCFGSRLLLDPCPKVTESEWRWEESPGCWVQCHLPIAKKAKHHHIGLDDDLNLIFGDPDSASKAPHTDSSSFTFELSFKSLVSSALSNRTQLHGYSRGSLTIRPDRRARPPLPLPVPPPRNYTSETATGSDDALDLFASAKSTLSSSSNPHMYHSRT